LLVRQDGNRVAEPHPPETATVSEAKLDPEISLKILYGCTFVSYNQIPPSPYTREELYSS
jgi:hypothetical protein